MGSGEFHKIFLFHKISGAGAARHVLCLQERRGLPLQGAAQTEEKDPHGKLM